MGDYVVLILSRRNGESFIIGENIKITVLSQRSNQVRIGIDAPRDLPVFREEVLDRRRQNANSPSNKEVSSKVDIDNPNGEKNTPRTEQKPVKIPEELVD